MPLLDIVVDTNVFAHCSCDQEDLKQDALSFARALLVSTAQLAMDDGGLMAAEYYAKLRSGTFGYHALQTLAANKRLSFISTKATPHAAKKTNQLIVNKRDRTFLRTAMASQERVFVSNDFADFSPQKRIDIKKGLSVSVVEPDEGQALLP